MGALGVGREPGTHLTWPAEFGRAGEGAVLDQEQLEGKVPYQVPGAWNQTGAVARRRLARWGVTRTGRSPA